MEEHVCHEIVGEPENRIKRTEEKIILKEYSGIIISGMSSDEWKHHDVFSTYYNGIPQCV
jgi:hypothetical protein